MTHLLKQVYSRRKSRKRGTKVKKKMIWVIIKHPKDKRGHAERIQNKLQMMQEIVVGKDDEI